MASQLTSSFLDPDPALSGPPTQTISGITNRAPVVDNPNIKLPSQEVKSLTATSAQEAIKQTDQAQSVVNGVTSQAQSVVSETTKETDGFVKDGLGKSWSPDKYSPSSIAGNTKYVDPKTGQIGSTSNLTKSLTGTVSGGSTVSVSTTKLNKIKSTMPKPKIPKPTNTPRIKTVKIPRPNSTKGAETLLNLPKTPTF